MAIPLRAETFDLHFMELHALGEFNWGRGRGCLLSWHVDFLLFMFSEVFNLITTLFNALVPSVRVHRPICNWILDMDRRGTKIEKYAISESGDFLATFGSIIELWDLDVTSRNAPQVNPASTTQPSPPKPYAHTSPLSVADLKNINLSISWDGSLVATSGVGSPLIVYAVNNPKSPRHDQPVQLEVSAHGCNTDLSTFAGRGVFHSGARNQTRSPQNEIFLAVDCVSVTIYSIQEPWERLRTIHTAHSGNICSIQARLCSIQARHFACLKNNDSISVWNLDTGRTLCTINIATSADTIEQISLSGDASVIVLDKTNSVSSTYYCSSTGVRLATSHSDASGVISALKGDGPLRSTDGIVQRTEDLAEIFRYKPTPVLLSKDKDQYMAFLEDVGSASLFQQTWKSTPCSDACLSSLDQLKGSIGSFADYGSGLKFSIKWNPFTTELCVTITDITTITEPELTRNISVVRLKSDNEQRPEATFAPRDRSLIVTGQNWISVFSMPTWYRDKLRLRTVVRYVDTAQMDIKKQLKRIMQCPHERLYLDHPILGFKSLLTLKDDAPATPFPPYISKSRLTEYFNRHINDYVSEGGAEGDVKQDIANNRDRISMMEWVCQHKDADYRDSQLKKLLSLSEGRWIPEPRSKFSPMEFFLNKAEEEPKNMKMFYLFWVYCYHRAMSEQKTDFLSPITACLPSFLHTERSHSETALKALHQMAFFPVVSRPLIMLRHALIHPLEFRLDFWKHNRWPLFKYKEPILQLETSGTRPPMPPMIVARNDTFQEQIFAATFNMIWTDQSEPVALKDNSYAAGVSPSIFYWITMAPFVIGHILKPWVKKDVTNHNFPLEALDNPALSALILYKW